MESSSEVVRLDKAIAAKKRLCKQLEELIEKEKSITEESLRKAEKKASDANGLFEKERACREEKLTVIEQLTDEIGSLESGIIEREEELSKYKRFKEILFKLKSIKQEDEAKTSVLPQVPNEEEQKLKVSDFKQLLDLMTNLTEQNISIVCLCDRGKETLEKIQPTSKMWLEKIQDLENEDEELIKMEDQINKKKKMVVKLKQSVQLYDSLKTVDEKLVLDALSKKVKKVYRFCTVRKITTKDKLVSTTDMLTAVEHCVYALLNQMMKIPENNFKKLKKVIFTEKQKERHIQSMRKTMEDETEKKMKYIKRAMSDIKKREGKRLMPRSIISKNQNRKRKTADERPPTPEEIVWDEQLVAEKDRPAVMTLWEDWRLDKDKREAALKKQRRENEKRATMHQSEPVHGKPRCKETERNTQSLRPTCPPPISKPIKTTTAVSSAAAKASCNNLQRPAVSHRPGHPLSTTKSLPIIPSAASQNKFRIPTKMRPGSFTGQRPASHPFLNHLITLAARNSNRLFDSGVQVWSN